MSLEVKKRFKISYYDIDGRFVWSKIDYFKNQEEANKEIYIYLYVKYRRNEFVHHGVAIEAPIDE